MIVLVGDKPSKKNIDPKVPFVGTKSYDTLLNWISKLNIDVTDVALANMEHIKLENGLWPFLKRDKYSFDIDLEYGDKVVALGQNASKYLTKLNIKHFKLPHPSLRNRKLNDKKYIINELKNCKSWIEKG